MKIGKQPKRWGKPSAKFLASKGLPADEVRQSEESEDETTNLPSDPSDGKVRIFLDDERPCPSGWTLIRTPFEFFKLLRDGGDELLNSVTEMSFDWYLGSNHVNGVEVSKQLAYNFCEAAWDKKPPYMPNLKRIHFHSSDEQQARCMREIFHDALSDKDVNRLGDIRLRLGHPDKR